MTGKIRGWERQILVTAVRLAPLKLYAIKTTLPSVIVYNLDYAEGVGFMTYFFLFYFRLYGKGCLQELFLLWFLLFPLWSELCSQDLFEISARVILPFESKLNTPPPFFMNLFIE